MVPTLWVVTVMRMVTVVTITTVVPVPYWRGCGTGVFVAISRTGVSRTTVTTVIIVGCRERYRTDRLCR